MLQLLTIWSHRKSMFFNLKMRSMRKIKTSKKRMSNVHHQNKMRNMWKISWSSKQTLSHTSIKDEEDEIDENRRYFILFCQTDVYQIRCHVLFIILQNSFFIQQCRKKRTSRVSKRHSERFSKQNFVFRINIIRINIRINFIKINVKINIIKFNFVFSSCHFRHRTHYHFRRFFRCHLRRCSRAAFYDLIDNLINAFQLINNNDVNEKTKSTNNHSH